MKVAVVLRLVPDVAEELELVEDGTDIDREWVGMKLNEFDDHALEQAILLKEQSGAHVTALALDGDGVDKLLQSAVARGADRIIKVTHDDLPPLPAATYVATMLASVLRDLAPDVVLTGVQTPEDIMGQLAPSLGASLGWPQASAIAGVQAHPDGLAARQEHSGGYAIQLLVPMPCVLGIQAASQPPRYVSGSKLRQAMSVKPEILAAGSPESTPVAKLLTFAVPETVGGATMWEGDADAVADQFMALLRGRGLVKG